MPRYLVLAAFVVLVLGGGTLIGTYNLPGPWYEALQKPWFNPPNWLFGPAWTTLYVLIALAGWRTFERKPRGKAMRLWWTQLVLNFAWSPVFFTMHSIGLALMVVLAMLLAILCFMALTWNRDRPAALLFLPYAAWVCFATALNAAIWWLN